MLLSLRNRTTTFPGFDRLGIALHRSRRGAAGGAEFCDDFLHGIHGPDALLQKAASRNPKSQVQRGCVPQSYYPYAQ